MRSAQKTTLTSSLVVCDVKIPVLSVSVLSDKGFTTKIDNEGSTLSMGGREACPIVMKDTRFYLMPERRLNYEEQDKHIAPILDMTKIDYWKLSGDLLIRIHNKVRT